MKNNGLLSKARQVGYEERYARGDVIVIIGSVLRLQAVLFMNRTEHKVSRPENIEHHAIDGHARRGPENWERREVKRMAAREKRTSYFQSFLHAGALCIRQCGPTTCQDLQYWLNAEQFADAGFARRPHRPNQARDLQYSQRRKTCALDLVYRSIWKTAGV